ncbi:hypothetical protein AVEN_185173-1 [Araneus ventricosus]|uniref:Uncharacterized protein n=1 Tax=Araneus ventricosus TaxID=182803 RepID=A0A4Y2RR45_ARAVE|nr:hypothetical protein AVEN_52414-1 [Araneus ventricosus]GBN79359.1 hypothetical protein AVEN_185173-1 [Araneus ventricosus]
MWPQKKQLQGVESRDLWRIRVQSEVILTNTSNPAMRRFIVLVSTNVNVPMRGCSILLEDKIPRMIRQLWQRPQQQHMQVTCTCLSLLTEENGPNTFTTFWDILKDTELVLPPDAHSAHLMSLCLFSYTNHICTCNTVEYIAFSK